MLQNGQKKYTDRSFVYSEIAEKSLDSIRQTLQKLLPF
jgi:hypothetical protein